MDVIIGRHTPDRFARSAPPAGSVTLAANAGVSVVVTVVPSTTLDGVMVRPVALGSGRLMVKVCQSDQEEVAVGETARTRQRTFHPSDSVFARTAMLA
ncbi:hypothetical protein [Nonomuraea gerenzanensis]|uniref:hypothetical protein n=1 Tax=Nonomuraea gerenzanensis TaxID=93944 RepID=UPI001CD9599C|nr:hypothetical protein [Nonomuraea gerenzanensis]UBU16381.1 hypothetical protein LCN96_15615 [Nonomuraea gerenzanensis]